MLLPAMEEFDILACGPFAEEAVDVHYKPGMNLGWDAEAKALIDRVWTEHCRASLEDGVSFYNGRIFHLEAFFERDRRLALILSDTDFKSYIGTESSLFGRKFPCLLRAKPLTVSIVLVTEDERIVVEKRKRFDPRRRLYHVVAGFVEGGKDGSGDTPDPFHTIRQEVREELAVTINTPLCATGLVGTAGGAELCFYSRLALSFADLLDIKAIGPTDGEIDTLMTIDNAPEAIDAFLTSHPRDFVPSGRACLMLYSRIAFGDNRLSIS